MLKFIVAAALALFMAFPSAALAQARPDFSGTWTFDEAKSDPSPARGGGGGGGGGRGGGRMGGMPATAMSIKQTATELTVERTTPMGAQTAVYKLDGSESTNTIGPGPATSKVSWDGAKLVIATTQKMAGRGGGEMTIEAKDVYSLDGNTLVVETARTTPMGTVNRKLVYTKN
jgi:hypothetical protein